jgi:hypothetical protein
MLRVFLALLLPLPLLAQQQKLDVKQVYELSLREYLKNHPQDVVRQGEQRMLFIKQATHLKDLPNSLDGVRIVFLDPATADSVLPHHLPRKTRLVLADFRPMFARNDTNHVYIFPVWYQWNAKKKRLGAPEYADSFCKVDFLTRLENKEVHHYFQKTECTDK